MDTTGGNARSFGNVNLNTPISSWVITFIGCLIIIGVILTLVFGSYSRKAKVTGWLKPDNGLIKITSPEAGNITKIHIQSGDDVRAGQMLVSLGLDATIIGEQAASDITISEIGKQLSENLILQDLAVDQLESDTNGLKSRIRNTQSELSSAQKQHSVLLEQVKVVERLIEKYQALFKEEAVSLLELTQQEDKLLNLEYSVAGSEKQISSLKGKVDEYNFEIENLNFEFEKYLSQLRREASSISERRIQASQKQEITIVAPITGRVAALPITKGEAISTEKVMLTILPEGGQFEGELFVSSKDSGRLEVGQPVRVKLHGFPYQKYGALDGNVKSISKTIFLPGDISSAFALQEPSYRILISLEQQSIKFGKEAYSLRSGMTLDADIIFPKDKLWRLVFGNRLYRQ